MREIKFRAWDTKENKWLFDSPEGFSMFGEMVIMGEWGSAAWRSISDDEPDRYMLQQYTGLKDKNGVEIYEGDIVRILYTDWPSKSEADPRTLEMYLRDLAHIGEVVFNPYYGWRVEDVGGVNCGEHGYIEVIGNVWESPGLINQINGAN